MIGLLIGAISGAVQFWMLAKFTASVTSGSITVKSVLLGVFQFFLPFIVLLCCALLLPDGLMWSGIGMAAELIICALLKFTASVSGSAK